jgi:hypothetical protein
MVGGTGLNLQGANRVVIFGVFSRPFTPYYPNIDALSTL